MHKEQKNIKDFTIADLESLCEELGEKKYRARQIFNWIYKNINDFDEMANIPIELRNKLKKVTCFCNITIKKRYDSLIDNTKKYLLELEDNNIIECVLMEYDYGLTACISTQVGCSMGCKFCASAIGGKIRNLTPGEMIDQILIMQNDIKKRISNIVLMGTGEPLDNFTNVIKFLSIINCKEALNIGMRHITISTCGLIPEIKKLADLKLQITLAISLHAPNDYIRRQIMPIANKYSIDELLNVCDEYTKITNKRITFEYSMIKGVNDSISNANELCSRIKNTLCHVNLIPVNNIEEREYIKSEQSSIENFKNILVKNGIEVTIRRELGSDIQAACGQLRKNYLKI